MHKLTFLMVLLAGFSTLAQKKDEPEKSPCLQNFEVAYQKIKDNYAGWNDKVTPANQKKFDDLTEEIKKKASKTTDAEACYFVMNEWLAFFDDGHLFINIPNPYQKAEEREAIEKRASKTATERFKNENDFKKYLDNKKDLNPVEGIWDSEDGMYRVGIVADAKKKDKYNAFLLRQKDELWHEGKVKFELKEAAPGRFSTDIKYADFSELKTFSRQLNNYLVIDKVYKYEKEYPKVALMDENEVVVKLPEYRAEKINNNTVLLTLPPFTMINAADIVMDLVTKNKDLILSAENLIIDLRDNPGGDLNAFVPLYPYISTGPILREGGIFRSSEENIYLLEHELESVINFPKYRRLLEPRLKKIIADMKNAPGQEIKGPEKVFQYVSNMTNPKKVAILVNENTASAAELVALEAKQSEKTVLVGVPTKGLADYIEVRDWGLPKYGWRLAFGLAKSSWVNTRTAENKGIKPDVKIPKKEADWILYTANYLNK